MRVIFHDLLIATTVHGDQCRSKPLSSHILKTFGRFASGFALAAITGVTAGFLLGKFRTLRRLAQPVVNALRGLPSAAIWPLCALIPNHKWWSQVVVVWFGATWPILINTMDGMLHLQEEILDSLRFMRMEWFRRWWVLILWAAPGIFTGLELGCAVAFLLTVTVEIFWPGQGGLGWYLNFYGLEANEPDRLLAGVFVIAVIGWGINSIMHWLSKLASWEGELPEVLAERSPRFSKILVERVEDSKLQEMLQSNEVTKTIKKLFGEMVLKVLYQDEPYIVPKRLKKLKSYRNDSAAWIQRDITISVTGVNVEKPRIILFARSWIDKKHLDSMANEKLDQQRLTIGTIVAESGQNITHEQLSYREHISQKLGAAFGVHGAIHLIQRARIIRVNGRASIFIQEFVPVAQESVSA